MTLSPTAEELQALGSALAVIAPDGWSSLTSVYETVGPTRSSTTIAQTPQGDVRVERRISFDALRLLTALRTRMYRPGAGTWFTATLRLYADGRIETDFDYDHEPLYPFAPLSWIADAERFPRAPENTPAWLAAKAEQPEWSGMRWGGEFTVDGRPVSRSTPIDATTTELGHTWSRSIAVALRALGHTVRETTDEGEDGRGNPVTYDELVVAIGGYMALDFFSDMVFWSIDVRSDQENAEGFVRAARDVVRVVHDVTGWVLSLDSLNAYEQRLLGVLPGAS